MDRVRQLRSRYGRPQPGQTMAEYALLIMLIAVVCIAAYALLGTNIQSFINSFAGCV